MPDDQWSQDNALLVLDAVANAIIATSSQGRILYANTAVELMFGYRRSELLGQSADLLIAPEQAAFLQGDIHENDDEWGAARIWAARELIAQKQGGDRFNALLTINQVATGVDAQFVAVIHDLTDANEHHLSLHAQREQLARAVRLATVGEMTASIAHEMNQPLTAIAMYAQACLRQLGKEDFDVGKLSEALGKLNEQALRAGAVNERVQQFVRNEQEVRQVLDVNQLLEDIRPLAESDARAHGIELVLELSAGLPPVDCSGINLQQVGLSLLRNAFDAMSEIHCQHGSKVILATELQSSEERQYIRVSVLDDGPGVDSALASSLFDPFVTGKKNGMGLGLSSCRSIISEEGGQLHFENRAPIGAHFFFRLPVARIS